MNIKRLRTIIDEWYEYIIKEDLDELEKDIEMPLKDFIIQLLQNVYDHYKDTIDYIPINNDNNSEYIIKSQNNRYTLEDFLINRLLRNISLIAYQKQYFAPESHYDHTFGEVLIDKERMQKELKTVDQRRKVVAHELLHAMKTQFVDHNVFRSEDYYFLKNRIKEKMPQEVNDFTYIQGIGQNGLYSHIGLGRYKESLDINNLDEIINELDAIRFSNDQHKVIGQLKSGLCIILNNPESSNTVITNYAYILERLLDKETLFIGLYIDPNILINNFNSLYTEIFQNNYNSSMSAIEILIEQINMLKREPDSIDTHLMLLETLHECIQHHANLNLISKEDYNKNIACLGNHGLLELKDGRLRPYNSLSYCDEYASTKKNK